MHTMQQPIRILMLFTILNRGGAETMVMNYYRKIDRTKVQFDFVVHRPERGAYEDEIEALGGRIYRMMPLHPLTFGKYQQQIAAFLDEHPEYSIIHGHSSELGYFFFKEAAKRNIPCILAHAHSSKALLDSKWPIRMYFKHALRKYVTHGVTCSHQAAEWLLGKHWKKPLLLQKNAIDTERFQYKAALRKQHREVLGLAEEQLVIGHVGSLTEIKNHGFLIGVFHRVHQVYPHARLVLVGQGWLEEKLRHQVATLGLDEAVIFLGERNDVHEVLNVMDVFVLPSIGEGFSMATLEAQCNGLPCLVSDVLPEEVRITSLVSSLSLGDSAEKWAQRIGELYQGSRDIDRARYTRYIQQAGYDIQENAQWLQETYLNF